MIVTPDSRLIEATLAGDKDAFGELVLRYQDRLAGALHHRLGSFHDARDVAQDAFILAYQKLNTFRQDSSFYAWLFRIAHNAAINSRRKKSLKPVSLNSADSDGDFSTSPRSSDEPGLPLESLESTQRIREALEQLPADYREALVLKELDGFRYEEIATVLNCPVGTVRSRIFRARQLLRERLAKAVEREQK